MIQAFDMGRIQSVFLVKFFLNFISNAAKSRALDPSQVVFGSGSGLSW